MKKKLTIFIMASLIFVGGSSEFCFSANLRFSDSFEDGTLSPWASVKSDSVKYMPSIARTGKYVKETNYGQLAGTSDGGGASIKISNYGTNEFYASAYFRYDSSFPFNTYGGGWKIARFLTDSVCEGKICLQWEQYFEGKPTGPGSFTFNPYGIANGTDMDRYSGVPPETHTSEHWNRYEVYVKFNTTPSASDGIVRIWINTKKVVELLNQRICTTQACLDTYFTRIAFPSNVGIASPGMIIYWDDIEFWDGMPSGSTSTTSSSSTTSTTSSTSTTAPPPPGKPYVLD